MKWSNRTHEFEYLREYIMRNKIYIFGAGEYGAYFYKNINPEQVIGFIDNSKEKQEEGYLGKSVFALEKVSKEFDSLFVIATSDIYFHEIRSQLLAQGFNEAHIISYKLYLHLFYYYVKNELIIHQVSVSVTQKCTLNCKNCSIMTTYLPEKKDYMLESLKQDLDVFFALVDYVGKFGIVGGEPFLYPDLAEYLKYIAKYQDRIIYKAEIVTNGTIVPSEEVLRLCKQYNIEISISDYTVTLPRLENNINRLIEELEKYEIPYILNKADTWVDFGYNYVNKADVSEELMTRFFDLCHTPCRLLRDGKLYYCGNSTFAIDANLNSFDEDNELDLDKLSQEDKMAAIEFDEGYNYRGYLNMCRHCNGMETMNKHYIEVAVQAQRGR